MRTTTHWSTACTKNFTGTHLVGGLWEDPEDAMACVHCGQLLWGWFVIEEDPI